MVIMPYPRDTEEIAERVEAAIIRYRSGEIGPVTFEALLSTLGVSFGEREALRREHRDECARNRNIRPLIKGASNVEW